MADKTYFLALIPGQNSNAAPPKGARTTYTVIAANEFGARALARLEASATDDVGNHRWESPRMTTCEEVTPVESQPATDDRLPEIQARLNARTPGVWAWSDVDLVGEMPEALLSDGKVILETEWDYETLDLSDGDAELIANAPGDLEWLITENEHLRERVGVLAKFLGESLTELFDDDEPPPKLTVTESLNALHDIMGPHLEKFAEEHGGVEAACAELRGREVDPNKPLSNYVNTGPGKFQTLDGDE